MTRWAIDTAHSEIKFKVKHLVVSTVTGRFATFSGWVETNRPDFGDARITFEADVDSISTFSEQRDGHLKSPDFFDAANHPKLSFVSKSLKRIGDNEYDLVGDMTIRGITREVKLNAVYNGTVKGFEGDVAAFEITGRLNRQEFGLNFNALTETGGVVVSDEVKLESTVELKPVALEDRKAA